jgi:hypothetical protein
LEKLAKGMRRLRGQTNSWRHLPIPGRQAGGSWLNFVGILEQTVKPSDMLLGALSKKSHFRKVHGLSEPSLQRKSATTASVSHL